MPWAQARSSESSGTLPLLQVEPGKTGKRIRLLGVGAVPDLAGTKYAEGTIEIFSHWIPDDVSKTLGGRRESVPCIGPRNGCIFHAEPLNWKTGKKSFVNLIEYVDYDAKKKTYSSKRIMGFFGGVKIWGQICQHAETVGLNPDEVDFFLSRQGTSKEDTQWTATMVQVPLEATIELSEFEPQPAFADDDIPCLIDPAKFPNEIIKTAQAQQEWYENLVNLASKGNGEAEEPDPETPPGPPAAATTKAATVAKAPISMPGKAPVAAPAATITEGVDLTKLVGPNGEKWAGKGRKPNWLIEMENNLKGAAKAPAAAAPEPPPPDDEEEPAAPEEEGPSAYDLACEVLDPWKTKMGESEYVEKIANVWANDAAKKTKYRLTDEQIEAAKIVLAGEGIQDEPAAPEPDSGAGEADVEELQEHLLALTKKSAMTNTFGGIRDFLKTLANGATAVKQIEDPTLLGELIALMGEGDEAIAAALAEAKA